MIIEYEGQRYPFDFDEITVKQAIKIEKHTGLTLNEFGKQINVENLPVIQALGWLILHGGQDIPIEDCDFKLLQLGEAFGKAAEEEAERRKAAEDALPPPPPPSGNGGGSIPDLSRLSSPTG